MPGWARRRLSLLALCLVWPPPDIPIRDIKPEDDAPMLDRRRDATSMAC